MLKQVLNVNSTLINVVTLIAVYEGHSFWPKPNSVCLKEKKKDCAITTGFSGFFNLFFKNFEVIYTILQNQSI